MALNIRCRRLRPALKVHTYDDDIDDLFASSDEDDNPYHNPCSSDEEMLSVTQDGFLVFKEDTPLSRFSRVTYGYKRLKMRDSKGSTYVKFWCSPDDMPLSVANETAQNTKSNKKLGLLME